MIRIAVVDDEAVILKRICRIINENLTDEKTVYTFNSSVDFFSNINNLNFDLVFLDIEIPEISGFQLAESIRATLPNSTIIFVSNMEHLVFESFRYSPLRFVRKSNLVTDLEEALSAYLNFYKSRSSQYMFSTFNGKKLMYMSEIIYIEVYSHKLNVHTNNSMITANGNLKDIEKDFIQEGFIRTHQSFLPTLLQYRVISPDIFAIRVRIT